MLAVSPTASFSRLDPPPTSPITTSPVWMPRRILIETPKLLLEPHVEGVDGLEHLQARPGRALGRVLIGGGVAEVHQQAIAEVLGDAAAEALDHLGAGGLVSAAPPP